MTISYIGSAVQLTDPLETILNDIAKGITPAFLPLGPGTVAIQPIGASGDLNSGLFNLDADDLPNQLLAYRFLITTLLPNPCKAAQQAVLEAVGDVTDATHEGLGKTIIAKLQLILAQRRRDLAACLAESGAGQIAFDTPAAVFRSGDLFRTGSGKTENGLKILVLIPRAKDLEYLQGQGVNVPTVVGYDAILTQAQSAAPSGTSITNVGSQGGLMRIDFAMHRPHHLTGFCTVQPKPSLDHDYQSYIDLELVDLHLDGAEGWFAQCTSEDLIRGTLQDALNNGAGSFNAGIAESITGALKILPATLQNPELTLTLLDVRVGSDGLHTTPILGLLLDASPDPCQSLRDEIRGLKLELVAALFDHEDNRQIGQLKAQIAKKQGALNGCLATNA